MSSTRPKRSNAGKRTSLMHSEYSVAEAQSARTPKMKELKEFKTPKAPPFEQKTPSIEEKGRSRRSRANESKNKTPAIQKKTVVTTKPRKHNRKKADYEDYYSEADETEESDMDEEDDKIAEEDLLEDEREDIDLSGINFAQEDLDGSSIAPWADLNPDEIPPLLLPETSQELNLPMDLLFRVTELYDFFRVYSRYLQFSPCLYEDFCAAMSSADNSVLLAEVHLVLMRLCWREDDDKNVQLAEKDTNICWNIIMLIADQLSYAEVLRLYVQSDNRFPQKVLDAISQPDYPFVPLASRLTVIEWLRDNFLESATFKEIIKNEGKIISESICRQCGKLGDIVMCDGCEAAYHPVCLENPNLPEGQWFCPICAKEQVKGISDCLSYGQQVDKTPLRIEPLGRDRHARIYWFTARRIFVQDPENNELYYYSTLPQLHELLSRLDGDGFEKVLVANIFKIFNDIIEQMAITVELTSARREERVRLLYEKNQSVPEALLHLDNANRISEILTNCYNKEALNLKTEDEETNVLSENLSITENLEQMMGISGGRLTSPFWSGNLPENEVLLLRSNKYTTSQISAGYRLGFDDQGYVNYKNYREEDLAKPLAQRKRDTDRRKYLCQRFSLEDNGAFKWVERPRCLSVYSGINTCHILEDTMIYLAKKLPPELFHRKWSDFQPNWFKIAAIRSVRHLREALLWLECGIRKPVFISQWWSGLGMTRFIRTTIEDRDLRSKEEEKRKKIERQLVTATPDDEDVVFVKFTKHEQPPKHAVWRQKDEQYRINGKGALGGWIWKSSTHKRCWTPRLTSTENGHEEQKPDKTQLNKINRLDRIASKFIKWRTDEITENKKPEILNNQVPGQSTTACVIIEASEIVFARDPEKKEKVKAEKQTLGEEVPFPLPKPFTFQRANKATSLLVLPPLYLKKMARQGGLNALLYYPGFNRTFKSNHHVWNYPCPRPHLELCWKWSTLHARSLQAVALQLRLLFACVRWSDLQTETKDEEHTQKVTMHLLDRDESRVVIGHKEMPPDGFYERYQLKVDIVMVDDDDEADASGMAGSRSRKRKSVVMHKSEMRARGARRQEIRWIDGVELKLWEITNYWRNKNGKPGQVPEKVVYRNPQVISRGGLVPPSSSMIGLRSSPKPKSRLSPVPYSTSRGGSAYMPRPIPIANRTPPVISQHINTRPGIQHPGTSSFSNTYRSSQIQYRTLPNGSAPTEDRTVRRKILDQELLKGEFLEEYRRVVADLPQKRVDNGFDSNGARVESQMGQPVVKPEHFANGALSTPALNGPYQSGYSQPATPSDVNRSTTDTDAKISDNVVVDGRQNQFLTSTRTPSGGQPIRTILRTPVGSIPQNLGPKRLLMIKRADGTTQILRPVSSREEVSGSRIIHRVSTAPPQARLSNGNGAPVRPVTGTPFRILSQPPQQVRPITHQASPMRVVENVAAIHNLVPSLTTNEERSGND